MACNSCSKGFTLFRKEKGCPSCGFSYCSKCLDNKIFLPKLNVETKVCAKCKKLDLKPNKSNEIEAPDAYYRRIGAGQDMQDVSTKTNSNVDSRDQQILERLKKLKESRNEPSKATTEEEIRKRLHNIKGEIPSTSDAELYSRLAKLKGVPIELSNKPVLPVLDTRTEEEQANDLIKQYMEQTNIDTKYKNEFDGVISDIESRVLKLKGTNPTPQDTSKIQKQNESSEDEEDTIKQIITKIKAEASLEENEIGSTNDELPFCEICNEDAKLRCIGCRYLFCKRCFNEHKDDDDGCNRYEPYEAPKNK